MARKDEPSYADLIYDVLASGERPLTFQEILDEVHRRRPITTRNPKGTIRSALAQGRQLVSLGNSLYGCLPNLLRDSLLRLPLIETKPANHPVAYPSEVRQALWPSFQESQKRSSREPVHVRLWQGDSVDLPLEFLGQGNWGCRWPGALRHLLVKEHAAAGDSLLIRVLDADARQYEVRFESRGQRDEEAVRRRNEELADAAAKLLVPRSYRSERFISELVIDLLGKGFYRSDVAPDDLEAVLKADPRFVDTGLGFWMLADHVTPETEAPVADRQELVSRLRADFPGAIKPALEAPPSLPSRRSMERTLADVGALLSEKEFASIDEANAYLKDATARDDWPPHSASTLLQKAQELVWDAWETPSSRERVRLARRALKISPDCADAYVLLAGETARDVAEALELYAEGVAAGERALGWKTFKEDVGHFWGILVTRPYMRARFGLAESLWETGKSSEAINQLWGMLKLNPNDNQGVRYVLLAWLLEAGDDAEVDALIERYDDISGQWAYGLALHAFRKEGDSKRARMLRDKARRGNRFAVAYLTGRKLMPKQLPDYIGIGDEDEAVAIAGEQKAAWQRTPGALAWLDAAAE